MASSIFAILISALQAVLGWLNSFVSQPLLTTLFQCVLWSFAMFQFYRFLMRPAFGGSVGSTTTAVVRKVSEHTNSSGRYFQ